MVAGLEREARERVIGNRKRPTSQQALGLPGRIFPGHGVFS